jgi:Domain of unknown function (DUF4281)
MQWETVYSALSALAFAGWVMLALAPMARARLVAGARAVALLLALAYLSMLLFTTEPVEGGGFSTLAGVQALFSKAPNVMLGWTHYLAFDLFIGSWETEDAGRRGVPHWLLLPCLFATLMVGPVGLLAWFGVRLLYREKAST